MERLQKAIAEAGYCSRRKAEELIINGKVKVNHQVVKELGVKVDGNDIIEIDGKILAKENKEYILLYNRQLPGYGYRTARWPVVLYLPSRQLFGGCLQEQVYT